MVQVAERDHPFVADLASERPRLGKAEMMRLAGCSPTDKAREGCHVLEMRTVPRTRFGAAIARALLSTAPVIAGSALL